jgi:hypothetical protein
MRYLFKQDLVKRGELRQVTLIQSNIAFDEFNQQTLSRVIPLGFEHKPQKIRLAVRRSNFRKITQFFHVRVFCPFASGSEVFPFLETERCIATEMA